MAEVLQIEVEKIDDPENPLRLGIDDYQLDELCNSIRDIGLQMPIIVKPVADRWEVVDGHRRILAVRRLGFINVTCMIHDAARAPDEAVKLACNLMREDNTEAEIASWLLELAEKHGYSLDQLCDLVKRSPGWINDRVALMRGYKFVFDALAARQINFAQAKAINRCKREDWAKMGLHFAVADNLPAARLTEYFVRNCPDVEQPRNDAEEMPVVPEPIAANGPEVICACCGGHKDPQNMMNIWLHKWHWDQVQRLMSAPQE